MKLREFKGEGWSEYHLSRYTRSSSSKKHLSLTVSPAEHTRAHGTGARFQKIRDEEDIVKGPGLCFCPMRPRASRKRSSFSGEKS